MSDPTVRHLGHGIATVPLPLPFPALRWVNAFVVEGDHGLVLIDVGVDSPLSWSSLTGGLHQLGYRIEDVDTLVGTHLHVDHVGMAQRVVDHVSPEFVMHVTAPERLPLYDDYEGFFRRIGALAARHGVPDDQVADLARPDSRPTWWADGARPTATVADGDRVGVGTRRWLEVAHTPGHDESHIVLVDSTTGIVFSGDHVLPRITPVVQSDGEANGRDTLGQFIDSLRRCERLMTGLTLPAHGPPIERGGERARQLRLHHERRLRDVEDALRVPATAWTVAAAVFRPNLVGLDARLALRETLAHLVHLERTGRAARFDERGVTWFRRC